MSRSDVDLMLFFHPLMIKNFNICPTNWMKNTRQVTFVMRFCCSRYCINLTLSWFWWLLNYNKRSDGALLPALMVKFALLFSMRDNALVTGVTALKHKNNLLGLKILIQIETQLGQVKINFVRTDDERIWPINKVFITKDFLDFMFIIIMTDVTKTNFGFVCT